MDLRRHRKAKRKVGMAEMLIRAIKDKAVALRKSELTLLGRGSGDECNYREMSRPIEPGFSVDVSMLFPKADWLKISPTSTWLKLAAYFGSAETEDAVLMALLPTHLRQVVNDQFGSDLDAVGKAFYELHVLAMKEHQPLCESAGTNAASPAQALSRLQPLFEAAIHDFAEVNPDAFAKQREIVLSLDNCAVDGFASSMFPSAESFQDGVWEARADPDILPGSWPATLVFTHAETKGAAIVGGAELFPEFGLICETPPGTVIFARSDRWKRDNIPFTSIKGTAHRRAITLSLTADLVKYGISAGNKEQLAEQGLLVWIGKKGGDVAMTG